VVQLSAVEEHLVAHDQTLLVELHRADTGADRDPVVEGDRCPPVVEEAAGERRRPR
jgi:hypothetical protein